MNRVVKGNKFRIIRTDVLDCKGLTSKSIDNNKMYVGFVHRESTESL